MGVLRVEESPGAWRDVGCGSGSVYSDGFPGADSSFPVGWIGSPSWIVLGGKARSQNNAFASYYLVRDTGATSGFIEVDINAADLMERPCAVSIRQDTLLTEGVYVAIEYVGIKVAGALIYETTQESFSGRVRVDWTPTTITVKVDGTTIGSVSNSTYASNTYAGLYTTGSSIDFDNVEMTSPATGHLRLEAEPGEWWREMCDGDSLIDARPLRIEHPLGSGTWIDVACLVRLITPVEPVRVSRMSVDALTSGTQARSSRVSVDVLVAGTQARVSRTSVDVLIKP